MKKGRKEVKTHIPGDKIDNIVAEYEADGFEVEKHKQDNGLWTI